MANRFFSAWACEKNILSSHEPQLVRTTGGASCTICAHSALASLGSLGALYILIVPSLGAALSTISASNSTSAGPPSPLGSGAGGPPFTLIVWMVVKLFLSKHER